jgi:hypothetical protein
MATEHCETDEAMEIVSHILLLSLDTFALSIPTEIGLAKNL